MPLDSVKEVRTNAPRGHYPALDGLRGLAVLMVLSHHFVLGYSASGRVHALLGHLTLFMWSGVDLFFVLSGFLISGILLDAKAQPKYFRTFYARRVLRIFPLYYGAVFAIFVLLPLLGMDAVNSRSIYYWTYLTNVDVALHGWPNQIISHFWSLAIEEQFYLLWPLVIFLIPITLLRRFLPALLLLPMAMRLIASLNGSDILPLHVGTLTHCDGLIMGSIMAVYLRTSIGRQAVNNRTAVIGVILIAMIFVRASFGYFPITFSLTNWNVLQRTITFTLISVAFSWVLFLCVGPVNSVQHFFKQAWLQWFGRYSYGLYVLHKPLMGLVSAIQLPAGLTRLASVHPFVLDAIYIPTYLIVSIVFAYASYHLFEKHFLRLKKYFSYRSRVETIEMQSAQQIQAPEVAANL
ncbi:MAG: acyltransferase [Bacteroidota bacterium]|nr:acyltransferase [Bacteroidota bacterium]MDP4231967.1 acyltransferase [Bacteroidota bacterium]MDP4241326.1 acyltransferase [Bacteroidota bacterium]MDP4287247.1 acyltransferase [Bacteroidota bacterium]